MTLVSVTSPPYHIHVVYFGQVTWPLWASVVSSVNGCHQQNWAWSVSMTGVLRLSGELWTRGIAHLEKAAFSHFVKGLSPRVIPQWVLLEAGPGSQGSWCHASALSLLPCERAWAQAVSRAMDTHPCYWQCQHLLFLWPQLTHHPDGDGFPHFLSCQASLIYSVNTDVLFPLWHLV